MLLHPNSPITFIYFDKTIKKLATFSSLFRITSDEFLPGVIRIVCLISYKISILTELFRYNTWVTNKKQEKVLLWYN